MYTWGYIKENALAKLNVSEEEANLQNFLSRFPYYANEAMTQICSGIKPLEKFFVITVYDKEYAWKKMTERYGVYLNIPKYTPDTPTKDDKKYDIKVEFWKNWETLLFTDMLITMPDDFISFSDDRIDYEKPCIHAPFYTPTYDKQRDNYKEVGDDYVDYYGYNQIICKMPGEYKIPYNARWFFFTKDLRDDVVVSAPADICDAIPTYMASQCLKIDDEAKSAILRNEFEMFLARIDNTTFKSQRTLHVRGGW